MSEEVYKMSDWENGGLTENIGQGKGTTLRKGAKRSASRQHDTGGI